MDWLSLLSDSRGLMLGAEALLADLLAGMLNHAQLAARLEPLRGSYDVIMRRAMALMPAHPSLGRCLACVITCGLQSLQSRFWVLAWVKFSCPEADLSMHGSWVRPPGGPPMVARTAPRPAPARPVAPCPARPAQLARPSRGPRWAAWDAADSTSLRPRGFRLAPLALTALSRAASCSRRVIAGARTSAYHRMCQFCLVAWKACVSLAVLTYRGTCSSLAPTSSAVNSHHRSGTLLRRKCSSSPRTVWLTPG